MGDESTMGVEGVELLGMGARDGITFWVWGVWVEKAQNSDGQAMLYLGIACSWSGSYGWKRGGLMPFYAEIT